MTEHDTRTSVISQSNVELITTARFGSIPALRFSFASNYLAALRDCGHLALDVTPVTPYASDESWMIDHAESVATA